MDHVGVVVDDLEAAVASFVELGLELEGEAPLKDVGGPRRRLDDVSPRRNHPRGATGKQDSLVARRRHESLSALVRMS
jgi:catechol 2,3-dioxygenase-like lactoylglutathione lyase family enzyme